MAVTKCFDVLVIGAGPAGLAIAAACAEQGLDVACLSPTGVQPWHNTYGIWYDELPADLLPTVGHSWQKVYVRNQRVNPIAVSPTAVNPTAVSPTAVSSTAVGPVATASNTVNIQDDVSGMVGAQLLGRHYAFFDNEALQKHLLEHCCDITWLSGLATDVDHGDTHATVFCRPPDELNAQPTSYCAHLVIAANGHRSPLVQRPNSKEPLAFQIAYGVLGRFSCPPIAPDSMMLMDFDDGYLQPEERQQPTFLYAVDMGDGRYFVEETALAVRPTLPFDFFKNRLERRLAARGCHLLEQVSEEHCLFPMNPLVPPAQNVLAYGAAASMVHPASGYMVGLALRYAPELAATIATSLQTASEPRAIGGSSAAAWQHLWPQDARYRQQLYRFGLEALLTMDSPQTQAFFKAFFAIPEPDWQGYLSNHLSTAGILRAMTQVFVRAPWRVRGKLVRAALQQPGMLLPASSQQT